MKLDYTTLIEGISKDLAFYLRKGTLNAIPYIGEIDPSLNIENLSKLLRIHFILTHEEENSGVGVIDFVQKLSSRLRRLKTATFQRQEVCEGEIKGSIDWKSTIGERCKSSPYKTTLFVCNQAEKNYDIIENRVLKELLSVIHCILHNDAKPSLQNEHSWLGEWVKDKQKLKSTLNQLLYKNPYLKRVDYRQKPVPNRVVEKVKRSRKPLYREAAQLLWRYRKLMRHEIEPEEAKELLRNTFIKPERSEVLFELYCMVCIVRKIPLHKWQIIDDENSNLVARWKEGGYTYLAYHDSLGSCRIKEPREKVSENLKSYDNYLGRILQARKKLNDILEKKDGNLEGGRPDILIEKWYGDNLVYLFVGEAKYTEEKQYALEGLKELLEYVALLKDDNSYVSSYESLFWKNSNVSGGLYVAGETHLNANTDGTNICLVNCKVEDPGESNIPL